MKHALPTRGNTSQAANIMEDLEAGAKLFLLDEDTSATNFMIIDARMQKLVAAKREPIFPFGRPQAGYARPRPQEVSAAINRLRTLAVRRESC
ncbi:MAG: P-loop domain-containing protein [Thermovirgaceae bacterium]